MTKIEKILGVAALIAIVIAVSALLHKPIDTVHEVKGISQTDLSNTNFTQINSTGGVIISNGIADVTIRGSAPVTLATASSTVCSILSPAATTTLISFAFTTTGSTTASTLVVATSTSPSATSTTPFVASQSIAASAQGTISFVAGLNNAIIGPSIYVNVGENGSLGGPAFFASGSCSGRFRAVSVN